MKVIYKRTIKDQIMERKLQAVRNNEEIDYIELDEEETAQFKRETAAMRLWTCFTSKSCDRDAIYFGVKLKLAETES